MLKTICTECGCSLFIGICINCDEIRFLEEHPA